MLSISVEDCHKLLQKIAAWYDKTHPLKICHNCQERLQLGVVMGKRTVAFVLILKEFGFVHSVVVITFVMNWRMCFVWY
jgi:hypothetical protein